jgi:hypothetical protein
MRPCIEPPRRHVVGVNSKRWMMTMMALATNRPQVEALPEPACTVRGADEDGVAWAEHDENTGITWWFERRDRDGRRIGRAIELGWGYDGAETCALGYHRGRYLATWAWWDPWGSKPELRTAIVEGDRRVAQDGRYLGPYFELTPVAVTPARVGWIIHYGHEPDGDTHRIHADRDGRLRP